MKLAGFVTRDELIVTGDESVECETAIKINSVNRKRQALIGFLDVPEKFQAELGGSRVDHLLCIQCGELHFALDLTPSAFSEKNCPSCTDDTEDSVKSSLWLKRIPVDLREMAIDDLNRGDVASFLVRASNEFSLELVVRNTRELQARNLYEAGLLQAFIATRTNNLAWPLSQLRDLFERADRKRLRDAGDPLPGNGPFTLYRGVSGRGAARRVRGFSWTADFEKADWFARRYKGLPDPAVYQITVPEEDVLAYTNEREEREFIILLDNSHKPVRAAEKLVKA